MKLPDLTPVIALALVVCTIYYIGQLIISQHRFLEDHFVARPQVPAGVRYTDQAFLELFHPSSAHGRLCLNELPGTQCDAMYREANGRITFGVLNAYLYHFAEGHQKMCIGELIELDVRLIQHRLQREGGAQEYLSKIAAYFSKRGTPIDVNKGPISTDRIRLYVMENSYNEYFFMGPHKRCPPCNVILESNSQNVDGSLLVDVCKIARQHYLASSAGSK